MTGLSLLDLDFLLNCTCSDLNRIPISPTYSNICPLDFLQGYKQVPMGISMMGTQTATKALEKVVESLFDGPVRWKPG